MVASRGRAVLAFEAKTHDWSRGIKQARSHRIVADLVYLIMPANIVSPRRDAELRNEGIGLITWDQELELFSLQIGAKRQRRHFAPARARVTAYLAD
jgi:hypothetical protein